MRKIKLVLLALGVLLLTACGGKSTAITSKEFMNTMTDEGFNLVDVKEQFNTYEEIKEAYVALSENEEYQIEFYVLDSGESAVRLYNYNKELFEQSKENSSTMSAYTSVDLSNKNKYTLSVDGKIKLLSRIDNTMIYLNVESQYKDKVKTILKKLGY